MKKILFVTARFPWPIITGDALRAYNQIKELSKENLVDVFSVEKANTTSGNVNNFINSCSSGNLSKIGGKLHCNVRCIMIRPRGKN